MSFVLLIMAMLLFCGAKFENRGLFNKEYLSHKQTRIIEGVFVILVLMSHYKNDYLIPTWADTTYLNISTYLGQGIVAMFFFYSGYGIMLNIRCYGYEYVQKLPVKFARLVFQMTLAIAIFAIVQSARGEIYPVSQYMLACIGWSSIGNSNWFIIMTLVLYAMIYISFVWHTESDYDLVKISAFTVLTAVCILFCKWMRLPSYYYNTLLIFPLGSWYAFLKKHIDQVVMYNTKRYYAILTVCVFFYILLAICRDISFVINTMWMLAFPLLIVIVSMKVVLNSWFFDAMGQHVFSIYILQRIPMILLKDFGFTQNHTYLGFMATFIITCIMAWIFDYLLKRVWNRASTHLMR